VDQFSLSLSWKEICNTNSSNCHLPGRCHLHWNLGAYFGFTQPKHTRHCLHTRATTSPQPLELQVCMLVRCTSVCITATLPVRFKHVPAHHPLQFGILWLVVLLLAVDVSKRTTIWATERRMVSHSARLSLSVLDLSCNVGPCWTSLLSAGPLS